MSQLIFDQIYPFQTLPVLAKSHRADLPKRADFFCHPFKTAAKSGVYAFPPIDFRFKLTESSLCIEAETDTGGVFQKNLHLGQQSNNNFVLLSDVSPGKSDECLQRYRSKIPDDEVPAHINKQDFGFYEVLLNAFVEEQPFNGFIQCWLGGVVHTKAVEPNDGKIWIKHASNVNMDSGFECLDAVVDTQIWKGWLAVVLRPTRLNQWVEVSRQTPLCQIVSMHDEINDLQVNRFNEIRQERFLEPIRWHMFDPEYGLKPGKYARQIKQQKKSV